MHLLYPGGSVLCSRLSLSFLCHGHGPFKAKVRAGVNPFDLWPVPGPSSDPHRLLLQDELSDFGSSRSSLGAAAVRDQGGSKSMEVQAAPGTRTISVGRWTLPHRCLFSKHVQKAWFPDPCSRLVSFCCIRRRAATLVASRCLKDTFDSLHFGCVEFLHLGLNLNTCVFIGSLWPFSHCDPPRIATTLPHTKIKWSIFF